jgi:dihydrofolate reductase
MSASRMELVVAVSENDVIGRANQLPWHMPADLQRFKQITLGKPILMGRKTHESIGKALPGRLNLVLTRMGGGVAEGCVAVRTMQDAVTAGGSGAVIMVIGGSEIYRQCLPLAQRMHVTFVHTRIADGDAFFDGWRAPQWRESARIHHVADAKNAFDYSFVTFDRIDAIGGN